MNKFIDSVVAQFGTLLRHSLTGLAGLGGLLLSKGWIQEEAVAAVDGAGASLTNVVVVVLSAILARILILISGKFLKSNSQTKSKPSRLFILFFFCALAGLFLPSCVALESGRVGVRVEGDGFTAGYSSKRGLEIEAVLPKSATSSEGQ